MKLGVRGFTLVQTIVMMALSAITIAAIAGIMGNNIKASQDADLQALIDTEHSLTLLRASSTEFLVKQFSLVDSESAATPLSLCLKGRGTSCRTFSSQNVATLVDPERDFNEFMGLRGVSCRAISEICVVEKSAFYRWICPRDNLCSELRIFVRTAYRGTKPLSFLKPRQNEVIIPSHGLLSRGDISFACTASRLLMGVDFGKIEAECGPISGVTETNLAMPAKTVGPGMEADTGVSNCASGFAELGLFRDAAKCDSGSGQGSTVPVNGGWSDWIDQGPCSVTCGTGTKTQIRTCTNPSPANGGANCVGPSTQSVACTMPACASPPIDGGWSPWWPLAGCSEQCGEGTTMQSRTCTNPAPSNGGKPCVGPDSAPGSCTDYSGCYYGGGGGSCKSYVLGYGCVEYD